MAKMPIGDRRTANLLRRPSPFMTTSRALSSVSLFVIGIRAMPNPMEKTTTAGTRLLVKDQNRLDGTNSSSQSSCSGWLKRLVLKNEPPSQRGKENRMHTSMIKPISQRTSSMAESNPCESPALAHRQAPDIADQGDGHIR